MPGSNLWRSTALGEIPTRSHAAPVPKTAAHAEQDPCVERLFHPTLAQWFRDTIGTPSPPQALGWPAIARGEHVLIAAPTGSGKTFAAFLCALDQLLRQGDALEPCTQVVYVSPLKALSNDIEKNLQAPLAALQARDPSLPAIQVMVRTGDTPAKERAKMRRRLPHVLV